MHFCDQTFTFNWLKRQTNVYFRSINWLRSFLIKLLVDVTAKREFKINKHLLNEWHSKNKNVRNVFQELVENFSFHTTMKILSLSSKQKMNTVIKICLHFLSVVLPIFIHHLSFFLLHLKDKSLSKWKFFLSTLSILCVLLIRYNVLNIL